MDGKLLWGLVLCLAGPLCAGCATSPGVVRGQSPSGGPEQAAAYSSPDGAVVAGGGTYAPGEACPECGCNDGGHHRWCHHCCCKDPTHRMFYHYSQPRHLVYPPDPTPAAVVQYPYYICKGPDDFFLQK